MLNKKAVTTQRRDKDFLHIMTPDERQEWAKEILERMMKAWGLSEKKQVATMLGCHPKMPGNWVQNGSIPWNVIYTCHLDTNTSLDWLYDGKLPTAEITPDIKKQLVAMAEEIIQMAKRMNLIKEDNPNGFHALARTIVADMLKVFKSVKLPKQD